MGELQFEYEGNRRGPRGKRGLPGFDAVPSSEALAVHLDAEDSPAGIALRNVIADRTGFTVNIADYADLKSAIAALPSSGGTVFVPVGRFYAGDWVEAVPMTKDNVRVVGAKMPELSPSCDRLHGGSVIEGRFLAFANNLTVEEVGFDLGGAVATGRYGGNDQTAADHPLGGTWDAFRFANDGFGAGERRTGLVMKNVIAMLRSPQSLGHAVLVQAATGVTVEGSLTGVGGVHAIALKCSYLRAGHLAGYSAAGNGVIIKSDMLSEAIDVDIVAVSAGQTAPGKVPWWTPVELTNGLHVNPNALMERLRIGSVSVSDAGVGLNISASVAGLPIMDGVDVGSVTVRNCGKAIFAGSSRVFRAKLSNVVILNCDIGIAWDSPQTSDLNNHHLAVGSLSIQNVVAAAIQLHNTSRVIVDNADIVNVGVAYNIHNNARLYMGKANLMGTIGAVFQNTPPTLAAGFTNFGGGTQVFEMALEGYGVTVKGLVAVSAGALGRVANFPPYLAPEYDRRFGGYLNTGSRAWALIGITRDGQINVNDSTAPPVGSYLSLDGIHYSLKNGI